jgi:hypothetical protein
VDLLKLKEKKMRLTFIRRSVVGAAMMLGWASLGRANTLEYFADLYGGGEQTPPFNTNVTLTKFNTNLGSLTAVKLIVEWHVTASIDVFNTDFTNAHHFTNATVSVPITVTAPLNVLPTFAATGGPVASASATPTFSSASPITPNMPVPSGAIIFSSSCPNGVVCAVVGQNTYTGIVNSGPQTKDIASSDFGAYSGAGFATFNVNTVSGDYSYTGTGSGTDKLAFGGSLLFGARIKVQYEYDPATQAPEPMTMMLVGSAILGLGVLMQRRRSKT